MFKSGRYSGLLRPISYGIDLFFIYFLAFEFFPKPFPFFNYVVYLTIAWFLLALRSGFYEIYRFTHLSKIMSLIGKQGIVFVLIVFSFFGFYNEISTSASIIFKYLFLVMLCITIVKLGIYFLLKKYRLYLGGNVRKVVIIGLNQKTDQLRKFFTTNPVYGYKLYKTFDLKGPNKVSIEECMDYILKEEIDEVYSSVAEIGNRDLIKLIEFVDNNLKILKFLPDNKEIYSKKRTSHFVIAQNTNGRAIQ